MKMFDARKTYPLAVLGVGAPRKGGEGREWEGRGRDLKGPISKGGRKGGEEESEGCKRERREKGPSPPEKKSWRRHWLVVVVMILNLTI